MGVRVLEVQEYVRTPHLITGCWIPRSQEGSLTKTGVVNRGDLYTTPSGIELKRYSNSSRSL